MTPATNNNKDDKEDKDNEDNNDNDNDRGLDQLFIGSTLPPSFWL